MLVVDDDVMIMRVLKNNFTRKGVSCDLAGNGKIALDTIATRYANNTCCRAYRLIITDIDMPVLNGVQFCIQAHRFFTERELSISSIYVHSSFIDNVLRETLREYRIRNFLQKPISNSQLDAILRVTLIVPAPE